MQEQGLLQRRRHRRGRRAMVGRFQRGLSLVADLLAEPPHGARRQLQFESDLSRHAALLMAFEDFLPQTTR